MGDRLALAAAMALIGTPSAVEDLQKAILSSVRQVQPDRWRGVFYAGIRHSTQNRPVAEAVIDQSLPGPSDNPMDRLCCAPQIGRLKVARVSTWQLAANHLTVPSE
jgi:hypothetical protein